MRTYFADAWQYDIVKAARSPIFNPSGDKPEGDVGKERALKYVIAGDPDSETPVIRTLGNMMINIPFIRFMDNLFLISWIAPVVSLGTIRN